MRKTHFLFVTLFVFQLGFSQLFTKERIKNTAKNIDNDRWTWGYYLGFNSFDFQFNYETDLDDILVETTTGFQVGLVGALKINNNIDLRLEPGVFFSTRNLIYNESYFEDTDFSASDLFREVQSTYIHFPLLVKFSTNRINNFKPFVIGGFSTAINLSSNEDNPDDNSSGEFRTTRSNYFYELGFGIDFYLKNFRFTTSIRGVFALNDELVQDLDPNSPWTSNISSLKTRAVLINFTVQ